MGEMGLRWKCPIPLVGLGENEMQMRTVKLNFGWYNSQRTEGELPFRQQADLGDYTQRNFRSTDNEDAPICECCLTATVSKRTTKMESESVES